MNSVKIQNCGTLSICDISSGTVTFNAINIVSPENGYSLRRSVASRFDGECTEISGSSDNHHFEFTRPLNRPLVDPDSFLLATQRKLLEILEEIEECHDGEGLMFDREG